MRGLRVSAALVALVAANGTVLRGWGTVDAQLSSPDLTVRVGALGGTDPVVWRNPEPPPGATDPLADAKYVYARLAAFSGGRRTPFDLNVTIWGADGSEITHAPEVLPMVERLFLDVYQWDPEAWKAALKQCCAKQVDVNKTMADKANMFWELLAEAFSTRALGSVPPDKRLLYYGPACFNETGGFSCSTAGIPGAELVSVVARVDGARDTLNPVTRIISWSAGAPFVPKPTVYTIEVPGMMQVASPHRELLDERPEVGGSALTSSVRIHAEAALGAYPDYNLAFIPVRHMVMQGAVPQPMQPGSSLAYATARDLASAFNATAARLFDAGSASRLVQESLEAFLTDEYYYMYPEHNFSWDGVAGIAGYKRYILDAPTGIAAGVGGRVAAMALEVGGQTAATATAT